ncbi:MAG: FAD-binding oxidoreductase [Gemmatimonadota bacterium]|nr:FAD-binding oxidoreductase [Gemmatimonadota bacterium]
MKRRDFLGAGLSAAAAASLPLRRPLAAAFREIEFAPADLEAVTGDGREIVIPASDVDDLIARLRGSVLFAGDEGYDEARTILNPSFDRYPALVVQPTGAADVQIAVEFARRYELLTAVKCGGHSLSGKSTCDRGLQVDLVRMRGARIDPVSRTARVEGGSLLGLLDHEAMTHDLVTPMGTVSHTGVGGLVLGGGFGRLARRFGLAIDNLLSLDVVTADGELRHASPDTNPELFWGLRGGGGNFGIVTSFEFRLHPMQRTVVGGRIMFPFERARELLEVYGDYGAEAPDELQLDYFQALPPGGVDGVAGFAVCWSGSPERADEVLAPIRAVGTPTVDQVGPMDYVALQRSGDIDDPRAMGTYLKGGFIDALPSDLARAIADGMVGHPARSTQLFFQQSGGAINRVEEDATAFPNRGVFGNMMTSVDWPMGAESAEHIDACRSYWADLEPFTKGFYTNDLDPELSEGAVDANWGRNLGRLVALKREYDPTNLFRLNANIDPTGG